MTQSYFFSRTDLDARQAQSILDEALVGADDGELYLEYAQSEAFVFDDNRLKTASFNVDQGFGLRAVCGESTGFAHASELSPAALKRAAAAVQAVKSGKGGTIADGPSRTNARSSILTKTRLAPWNSRPRPSCLKTSMIMRAPKTTACGRFPVRSPGNGRLWRSCGPAASFYGISARWCGSTCPSPLARATARKPAPTAPAAAKATPPL